MTFSLLAVLVAFGCADLAYIANAWVRRTGQTVMVRCNLTGETYFLTCRGSAWKGELYNCSQGARELTTSAACALRLRWFDAVCSAPD